MVEQKRNYPLVRKIFLVLFILSTLITFGLLFSILTNKRAQQSHVSIVLPSITATTSSTPALTDTAPPTPTLPATASPIAVPTETITPAPVHSATPAAVIPPLSLPTIVLNIPDTSLPAADSPTLAITNSPVPTVTNSETPRPTITSTSISSTYTTSEPSSNLSNPQPPASRPLDPTMVMMYISLITSTTSLIGFATTTYITLHRDNERHRYGRGRKKARQRRGVFGQGDKTMGCVLISYRRSDSADVAGRIYDCLIEEFGQESIFKDVDSIPLGVDFKEYLDQKVGESCVFLAIIGDTWLDTLDDEGKRRLDDPNDFVRIEIESAFNRKIPVIPLLVSNAHMPEEEDLPPSLRKLVFMNGMLIRPDPDFHNDMDRLISALDKYVG